MKRPIASLQPQNLLTSKMAVKDVVGKLAIPSVEDPQNFEKLPLKFIDLFAGIGGFRIGMTAVGGQCVFTSEWDRFAAQTYQGWYADDHVHTGDIRDIDVKSEIPRHDVLCAGFPCQPFSLAGVSKKNSMGRSHGFEDEKQGNLFFKILEVVDELRPPILFLENVKNLKSHDKGNTWSVIENSLIDRDYVVYSKVIDARYWVPQHRERVFIVCFDRKRFGGEERIRFEFPTYEGLKEQKLSSVLESAAPDPKYMLSDKLWRYLQDYAEKHRQKGNGFGFGLNGPDDVARTMSARYHKDGAEILIKQRGWKNPRRLTPREAIRLLGYNDRYAKMFGHDHGFPQLVSDTQMYRQCGNSVVPIVVHEIAKEIVKAISRHLREDSTVTLLT